MSHGPKKEEHNFDQSDSGSSLSNGSTYIQIALPSCRIEVMTDDVLYTPDGNGGMKPILAIDIKINDLLYVMRDNITVTEAVFGVQTVKRNSLSQTQVRDGTRLVNNVLMGPKNNLNHQVPITTVGEQMKM